MPKRSSKPSSDPSVAAYRAVSALTEALGSEKPSALNRRQIAAILGSRGGKKGGKARAAKLTPARRKEIAQTAARARWGPKKPS
jgi:hypothetical protein